MRGAIALDRKYSAARSPQLVLFLILSKFFIIGLSRFPHNFVFCALKKILQKGARRDRRLGTHLNVCRRVPVAEWLSHWLPTPRNASSSPPSCDILSGQKRHALSAALLRSNDEGVDFFLF